MRKWRPIAPRNTDLPPEKWHLSVPKGGIPQISGLCGFLDTNTRLRRRLCCLWRRAPAKLLTKDEARRGAVNIAKLLRERRVTPPDYRKQIIVLVATEIGAARLVSASTNLSASTNPALKRVMLGVAQVWAVVRGLPFRPEVKAFR
jgi:hypothetical protein